MKTYRVPVYVDVEAEDPEDAFSRTWNFFEMIRDTIELEDGKWPMTVAAERDIKSTDPGAEGIGRFF